MFKIYKLFHPLSNRIYIGKTCNIVARFAQHLSEKRVNKRTSWIRSLKNKYGQAPFIEIIQDDIKNEDWANSYERSWISYYRNNYGNSNVLNMTDGGDGQVGLIHSNETKVKMSLAKIGKRMSPATEFRKGAKTKNSYRFPKGHCGIGGGNTGNPSKDRKIKVVDIETIKELWMDGMSFYAIGKEFRVDSAAIRNIVINKTYKSVIKIGI